MGSEMCIRDRTVFVDDTALWTGAGTGTGTVANAPVWVGAPDFVAASVTLSDICLKEIFPEPSAAPSFLPSAAPSAGPTPAPTPTPSAAPSAAPSAGPTPAPSLAGCDLLWHAGPTATNTNNGNVGPGTQIATITPSTTENFELSFHMALAPGSWMASGHWLSVFRIGANDVSTGLSLIHI